MSSNIRLLKNSGIYGIVQILQKCIGLVMLPIYMDVLTPNEKGTSDLVIGVVAVFAMFYTLSISAAAVRFYTEYRDDNKKIRDFWGTCVSFVLINGIFMTIILILTQNYILLPILNWNVKFFPYVLLALISITLNPVYAIFQSTLQAKEESKKYGFNNLTYFIVNLVLNIVFVVGLRLGALGVLLALAITDTIFFIYTIIVFAPQVNLGIKKPYLVEALKYSIPLLPHSISGWVITMVDRVFLNKFMGKEIVGIYSTGAQFGNIINVLTSAINQAYVPWFFDKMKEKEKNEIEIVKIAEYLSILYGFMAMGMSLFGPEVFEILPDNGYADAWKVIPALSFAFVFNGIYYFFVNPLFYNKRGVKFIAIGTFAGAFFNVILNIIFIPWWGGVGSSLASMVSNIIACILIYIISHKIEPIKFRVGKMLATATFFFGVSQLIFILPKVSLFQSILLKSGIVVVIMLILMIMHNKEVKLLYSKFISTRKNKYK
jgi:O-antigen/teichoic acid export membrane protein